MMRGKHVNNPNKSRRGLSIVNQIFGRLISENLQSYFTEVTTRTRRVEITRIFL
eukprot:UN11853